MSNLTIMHFLIVLRGHSVYSLVNGFQQGFFGYVGRKKNNKKSYDFLFVGKKKVLHVFMSEKKNRERERKESLLIKDGYLFGKYSLHVDSRLYNDFSNSGRISKSPRRVIAATFFLITAKIDRFFLITANLHNLIAARCKTCFLLLLLLLLLPPSLPPPSLLLSNSLLFPSSSPPIPMGMDGRARDGDREGGVLQTMSNCQSIILQLHDHYGCILSYWSATLLHHLPKSTSWLC